MKLLVITPVFPDKENKFYGGIFVKEQVKALARYVDEINVISPIPRSFGLRLNDKICKDYYFGNTYVYFPRFFILPLNYFKKIKGSIQTKIIKKIIEKENINFDVIHAHFTWPSGYAGVKLAKKFNVPVVVTGHGYDVYDLPFRNKFWLNKIKWILFNSNHIITVSKRNFKILTEKLNVHPEKISVIPNGFDSKRFRILSKKEARKDLGLPLNKDIILNVGNLIPVKGQKYLIQAMKIVHEQKEKFFELFFNCLT